MCIFVLKLFYIVSYLLDRCPVDSELFSINATFSEITANRLHYPRLFSSGYLESARFSGSTDVYFRCQVLLCYDYTGKCFEVIFLPNMYLRLNT